MKKKLDEKLVKEFPLLYSDRNASMRTTCMCWGFAHGDGWYKIIHKLSQKLEPMIAAMPPICYCGHPQHDGVCSECEPEHETEWGTAKPCDKFEDGRPRASQVKEKFGTLRFYMSSETEEMSEAIEEAEEESARTCETCGRGGRLRPKLGWIQTLCWWHHFTTIVWRFFRDLKYRTGFWKIGYWIRRKFGR